MTAGIRPPRRQRRFGQHFLEAHWAVKVVAAIAPRPADVFLEIGPGRGALTRPLAGRAGHVVAVEIDREHAAFLAASPPPRTTVLCADVLTLSASRVRDEAAAAGAAAGTDACPLRVAGNLPYNAAAPILFALLRLYQEGLVIADATVMLQREVADRLLARPGTKAYGVLSVLVRHRARVDRLLELPPGAFRPPPQVRSTVVRLVPHPADPPVARPGAFEALVKILFQRRRKTLVNALAAAMPRPGTSAAAILAAEGFDPRRRPETLDIPEFARLSDALERLAGRDATAPLPAVL